MSGIDVAGLVLGAFPLILSSLDYYRKGLEPLEEWWNFRTHFIAFIDDVRHQMMRYRENMIRLLDPIIADNDSLKAMVEDPMDPRWSNKTLDKELDERLSSELDRFLRIVTRMHELTLDLYKLLQIEDGKRLKLSFSKKKQKKIDKLAKHNQELEEILGYSERIVPISDKRKASEPVSRFEKLRQHAYAVHQTLANHWKCHRRCKYHAAHLSLRAEEVAKWHEGKSALKMSLRNGEESSSGSAEKTVGFQLPLSLPEPSVASPSSAEQLRASPKKRIPSSAPVPASPLPASTKDLEPIADLCAFLVGEDQKVGRLDDDDSDRTLEFSKLSKKQSMKVTGKEKVLSFSELLKRYQDSGIVISRRDRFEMATHIASALLQTYRSPWLPPQWTKGNFYFLADDERRLVCSRYPLVSRKFASSPLTDDDGDENPSPQQQLDQARECLSTLGIMILELIFGKPIEDCKFRCNYYGVDGRPNDQTDVSTAQRWASEVLGDSGPEISDVVRRCLDCSFGPEPNFADVRFREAVYEGVIQPLRNYAKLWREVMP
ncbi:hypothetical protein VM1G_07495 [Cytospora mali]|uniref:DUF7580 domain-containing protein n=1 Tax=Cytospora mali TaxID=578113 RepID=A0A194W6Q5_CYTMA|nr:hypothetical protein VM1G_07495 [Valsa mali]